MPVRREGDRTEMLPGDADHQQSGYMCFGSMLTLSYLKHYTHIPLNAYSYINDSKILNFFNFYFYKFRFIAKSHMK